MQIPWKRVAIAVLIVLVLMFVFFIGRKKERFENQKCTPDQDEIDGICYERCREGFSANGENCYEVCKSDEKSEGLTCTSKDGAVRTILSYSRNPISNVQPQIVENVECDEGYENYSGYCTEKCKEGFTRSGFICIGGCPSGAKNMGIMCADDTKSTLKESYFSTSKIPKNKETSNVLPCPDGYSTYGITCIENCPSDHILKGAFCVEKCKTDETDLDTMCLKGQTLRTKTISVPVTIPVSIKTS